MSSPYTVEGGVSHPGPEPDIDAAREILLADPYYLAEATARGLSATNTTEEWRAVATSDPIETYTMLTYPDQVTPPFIREACESLGFAIDERMDAPVSGDLWNLFVQTGQAALYDMVSYVFLMNPLDPAQYGPYWYGSVFARLPNGWGYNYAHLRNSTVDAIFANSEFLTDKQASYDELADILINQEIPAIYESQGTMGMVLNAGYNYTSQAIEVGGVAGPGIAISGIGGSRMKPTPPVIPGFSTAIVIVTTMVTVIGLIYVTERKRR
jgi:hypothetical protein